MQNKRLRKYLVKSISLTTRKKRSRERQGRDYFFVNEAEFKQRLRKKKILEWTKYLGYYYATPREFIEEELGRGRNVLLCLDLKGALAIKRFYSRNALTIFIAPPELKALKERIKGRCRRTKEEEVLKRLKLAKKEILACKNYDYAIVNKDLGKAVDELKGIILKKIGIRE